MSLPFGKINGKAGFDRVYGRGSVRRDNEAFSVRGVVREPADNEVTGVGFAVPNKVSNAVTRNRMKRLLREDLRQRALPRGVDLVITVKKPGADLADVGLAAVGRELEGPLTAMLRKVQRAGSGSNPSGQRP